VRLIWLGFCLLLTGFTGPGLARAGSASDGRLVLYLEREDTGVEKVRLVVGALSLLGVEGETPVPLNDSTWTSDTPRSGIQRLAELAVPAGSYDGLLVRVDSVTAPVGVALIHPTAPDSLFLPAEIQVLPGRVAFWVLRWRPREADAQQAEYRPDLSLDKPEIPPPGGTILVSNENSETVTLVDRFSLRPRGEILVGKGPRGMAWSREEQRLYVALAKEDAIAAVDLVSHRKEEQATLHAGDEPSRLWLDEESMRLFVLNGGSSTVSVLDARFLQESDRIVVESDPTAMAFDGRKELLYLTSRVRDTIAVYDTRERRQAREWSIEGGAKELLLDAEHDRLYVGCRNQPRVLVLDDASGAVLDRIDLCSQAAGIALDPVSQELIVSANSCKRVSFSVVAQAMEIAQVSLPYPPRLLDVDPSSAQAFVCLPSGNAIAVIANSSRALETLIPVGLGPYDVLVP
jgi:DNA-binding beta-propeller fold protein YncE